MDRVPLERLDHALQVRVAGLAYRIAYQFVLPAEKFQRFALFSKLPGRKCRLEVIITRPERRRGSIDGIMRHPDHIAIAREIETKAYAQGEEARFHLGAGQDLLP